MRKSFFRVIRLRYSENGIFGSEEHVHRHTNLLKSQNFDEDMLVKPDNLHNSIQMKKMNLKYATHRLHTYITSSVSYFIVSRRECLSDFENVCGNCILCYMLIKLFVFCKVLVFLYVPCLYAFRYFSIHHIVDRWPGVYMKYWSLPLN